MANLSSSSNNPKKQADATNKASEEKNIASNQHTLIADQPASEAEQLAALGLVESKAELLALFTVEAYPILVANDSKSNKQANQQRLELYQTQYERTKQLYLAPENIRPTYPVQSLKHQFKEYDHFKMAAELDKRGKIDIDDIRQIWQQLHIVDDIIIDLVQRMPAHRPVGWQITSQSRNYLCLPTVGRLRIKEPIADQTSINSYVLGQFGVMSFTFDRGYYIGHVLGYLFSCYYFAYLSIGYGVTSLPESAVADFDYASLKTPYLVRLLQTLDGESKKRIYQLAIICAKLSIYATDKRIEKLLVAEVNDFSKKEQKQDLEQWLAEGVMPLREEKQDKEKNKDKD